MSRTNDSPDLEPQAADRAEGAADGQCDIPTLVRQIRARLRLSQEALARTLDVSYGSVNAWERGRTVPRATHVAALRELGRRAGMVSGASVLVVSRDELADRVGRALEDLFPHMHVRHANGPFEAMLLVGVLRPSVIVVDTSVPDMATGRMLRALEMVAGIPTSRIVLVDPSDDADDQLSAHPRVAQVLSGTVSADGIVAAVDDALADAGRAFPPLPDVAGGVVERRELEPTFSGAGGI